MNTFIPFDELTQYLEFDNLEEDQCTVGSLGGLVIGSISNETLKETPEAMTIFKMECLKHVAKVSSTVILRTACGCEQETNLPEFRKELHIPIHVSGIVVASDSLSPDGAVRAANNTTRIFRFDETFDEAGFKVYREVL